MNAINPTNLTSLAFFRDLIDKPFTKQDRCLLYQLYLEYREEGFNSDEALEKAISVLHRFQKT